MSGFILVLLFLLGLVLGSFINVLIFRVNSGETIKGRSMCMSCGKKLEWQELIPVLSFIMLRARCGSCGSKISWQYPLVELTAGLVLVAVAFVIDPLWLLPISALLYILEAAFFLTLLAISVYDIRHKIILNSFSLALLVITVLFEVLQLYRQFSYTQLWYDVLSAFGAFVFFASMWFLSRGRWMGFGDAKIAFSIGLFLGYPEVIYGIFFAFWIGAFFGIFMLLARKYGRKSEMPFAPFLALGTMTAFYVLALIDYDPFLWYSYLIDRFLWKVIGM